MAVDDDPTPMQQAFMRTGAQSWYENGTRVVTIPGNEHGGGTWVRADTGRLSRVLTMVEALYGGAEGDEYLLPIASIVAYATLGFAHAIAGVYRECQPAVCGYAVAGAVTRDTPLKGAVGGSRCHAPGRGVPSRWRPRQALLTWTLRAGLRHGASCGGGCGRIRIAGRGRGESLLR